MSVDVCMVVHQYYYQDARVIRYAEALAENNLSVDILSLRKNDAPAPSQTSSNICVYQIPMSKDKIQRNHFVEYIMAFVLFSLWLVRLYAQRRYKVIHVHNMPDFLIFCAIIPRIFGAKLILDIHDPMPEFYQSKFGKTDANGLMVRLMRWQEKCSAIFANSVITANYAFQQNLIERRIPSDKISVVNNIADHNLFNPARYANVNHNDNRFILLYPGTIAKRYGLDVAIRALPQLTKTIPNLCLRIIGPYSTTADELRQLATDLSVANFVEILPAIALEAVPEQMLQADIGIYMALPDPHMLIATPSKTLEYAAMGLPIVTSKLPAVEAIFDVTEVCFFMPGDSAEFAECVLKLYQHPEKRQTLIDNMQAGFSTHHNWEHERQTYMHTLHRLRPDRF